MDLAEVMRSAGSTRRFRPDPVPADLIGQVLDNARFAPSGANRQGWRVIVVRDPVTRTALRDLYRHSWYEYHAPLYQRDGRPVTPDHYADHLDEVPVHLIVLVRVGAVTTTLDALDQSRVVGGASIYPFVQNIILGLRAQGLGTTLSTVLVPMERQVRELLHIPEEYLLAAHLGVGWPAGHLPTRLNRKPMTEFTTLDTFDGPPFDPARSIS